LSIDNAVIESSVWFLSNTCLKSSLPGQSR